MGMTNQKLLSIHSESLSRSGSKASAYSYAEKKALKMTKICAAKTNCSQEVLNLMSLLHWRLSAVRHLLNLTMLN